MPFEKGKSGNSKGRPKGSKNKSTLQLRERVTALLENNFDQLESDLEKLEVKDRVNAYIKLIEYSIPKLQRVEPTINLGDLSDQEINQMFNIAISNLNYELE